MCPHCRRAGALIGHGFLRGYAERESRREVRGRRFLCSNRHRRPGCGHTFSVAMRTVLLGFVVRTLTLMCFADAVLGGVTRRAAWLSDGGRTFSLSSGYRLWQRLLDAQSSLRVALARHAPAPPCDAAEPLAEVLAHLAAVVGHGERDRFGGFQMETQRGLFDT